MCRCWARCEKRASAFLVFYSRVHARSCAHRAPRNANDLDVAVAAVAAAAAAAAVIATQPGG